MTDCEVMWTKSWDGPILPPVECRHEGLDILTINQRLEPAERGKGQRMACDAIVCMRCGSETHAGWSVVQGLEACMDEHGWNRDVGLRLYDLAAARREDLMKAPLITIWMGHALGWTGKQIVDAVNATIAAGEAA